MVENAQVERTQPPNEYHYVPLTKTKSCVAPLTSDLPPGKDPKDKVEYNFWAVGSDECCVSQPDPINLGASMSTVCNCDGDVASGVIDSDLSGEFRMAAYMASIKYGLALPSEKPLFTRCSKEKLVALDGIEDKVAMPH